MNLASPIKSISGKLILAILLTWLQLPSPAFALKSLRVSWNANTETNVVGYKVYYGTASQQYTSSTNVQNVTSIGLKGFSEGVTYFFNVTAYNSQGAESGLSTERSITILPIPTSEPAPSFVGLTNFSVSANVTNRQIDFQLSGGTYGSNWILSAQSSNPTLIPSGNISFSNTNTANPNSRSLYLTPTITEVGTSTIRVSITDGIRSSSTNFLVTVTTPNLAPVIAALTNSVVQTNVSVLLRGRVTDDGLPANPGYVTAQWTKVSGPGTVTFGTPNFAFTSSRFSLPGFYRLRLTATDGELTSVADVYVYVKIQTDTTAPVVSQLGITEITSKSVTVNWLTDELANDQVEFTPEGGQTINTLLNLTPRTNHTVTLSNLTAGVRYSIRAKSRDSSGNRTTTSPIVVTTLDQSLVYLPQTVETAVLTAPMTLVTNLDGQVRAESSQNNSGNASFTFYTPVAADYYIWARVWAPSTGNDSFTVALDSGTPDVFDASEGTWGSNFQWIEVNGRNVTGAPYTLQPRIFRLSVGNHNIKFNSRESGTGLNRLIITNDPNFIPEDDQPVAGFNTALTQNNPIITRTLPTGFSMISSGLSLDSPTLQNLLPDALAGSVFLKYDPASGSYETNSVTDTLWDVTTMTMSPGEGGLLFNPASAILWSITGSLNPSPAPINLTVGPNLINPGVPFGGLLSQLIPTFVPAVGDTVQRVNEIDGSLTTYTYGAQGWDEQPSMNLGESVWLNLVSR